jgi:hypothetical protein
MQRSAIIFERSYFSIGVWTSLAMVIVERAVSQP